MCNAYTIKHIKNQLLFLTPYQLLTAYCYDISHHIKQSNYGAYLPLENSPLLYTYYNNTYDWQAKT